MLTHTLTRGWASGGRSIARSVQVQAGAESNLDEAIPNGTTNGLVAFSADVSQLACLFILSDRDITIKTNSASAEDNTFALQAEVPFLWIQGDPALQDTAGEPVTADIAAFYVTNSSGSVAALQVRCLLDPTV